MLDAVARYYTDALARHGATARGVDWNSEQSQELRLEQLCLALRGDAPLSVNDLGCGYGHLLAFLERRGMPIDYLGIDISQAMIEAARARAGGRPGARFLCGTEPDRIADYTLASGIFNVRANVPDADWQRHLLATLQQMHAHSRRGFAFNCLSSYSDPERRRADLYYADPLPLFDHCKRSFSRDVALLHDYGLYEFTLIVRKEPR